MNTTDEKAMKAQSFVKHFDTYEESFDYMNRKNISFKKVGNSADILCVVPGPEDNFAVVDLMTAIELELGYVWASSSTAWVANPWKTLDYFKYSE